MLSEFYKSEQIPLKEAFGKEYPVYFSHPALEYHALVRFCGVIDLTHWRVLRRVENGFPWYGIDFSGDNFPQEARLDHTVSYTKGCFRGQETLARLQHRGHVNWVLVGLVAQDGGIPGDSWKGVEEILDLDERLGESELRQRAAGDARILDLSGFFPLGSPVYLVGGGESTDDRAERMRAGWIASSVCSLALRRALFMGYLRRESSETQQNFLVNDPQGALILNKIQLPTAPRIGNS